MYGAVSLNEIAAHDATYVNTHSRNAQDNLALYKCLMNSLNKEGKEKVALRVKEYKVGPECSGPLLLKVIITESHIDTSVTVLTIRNKLNALPEYLRCVQHSFMAS